MKLDSSTIRSVAAAHKVSPRKLLRAVAKNWETGHAGSEYARQLVLDSANAEGPGMASRGEWANSMLHLLLLTVDGPLPTFCECRCGCKSHASATYCGPCRRGCCGETAESIRQEEFDAKLDAAIVAGQRDTAAADAEWDAHNAELKRSAYE